MREVLVAVKAKLFFEKMFATLNSLWNDVLMSSYNRVTLIGNLTQDPELKQTKSGRAVGEISLALNRAWTTEKGEKREEVTFVEVILWGRDAENAATYLKKGRSVLVEGRLQMDSWTDTQSGQARTKLRIVAESIQFMGAHQETPASDQNPAPDRSQNPGRRSAAPVG
jgi:single-strand DNA-binding protein